MAGPSSIPLRVQQVALALNGALATFVGIGYITGMLPYGIEEPILARKAGVAFFGGAIALWFAASRVRTDPRAILLAFGFVGANLCDSLYEWVIRGDQAYVPPSALETSFFSIYVVTTILLANQRRAAR